MAARSLTSRGRQCYSLPWGKTSMSSQSGRGHHSEVVHRLTGDLDFRAAGPARSALLDAVDRALGRLVIDLTEVDFIDSSGIAVLHEAARQAGQCKGRIRLRGLHPHHHRLLHTIGLADRFDLEPATPGKGAHESEGSRAVVLGEPLRFPGEPASVPLIRNCVGAVARELGFSEGGVRDILIAVSEAATNALKHGSPRGRQDEITVRCHTEADRLVIEVMDRGVGFDPLSVPVPVAEQMQEGGMGIFFMRTLMDEVTFDCSISGTTARLVKCRR
jgi:serine/threonine-protein kinase RsbW